MSASNVKAGGVFVEIGADPRKFFAALNRVNRAMSNMGRSLAGAGAKLGGMGVASLAPFAAAVRAGAGYQSTLLNIQASTGATAAELDKLKAASMQMSAAMGKGPTEIAGSFLELLKAGMSVEQVLGGAGKAAIEFAAVGQMDVAQAAVVMADAMNVFGVDASRAANSISSAADASSTSIELMAQSFSQVSAVAALANQSIDTTSAALAVLANAGVKGSDAGTSLKTMLMRLMAPANDAVGALSQVGLSVQSFRNADGTMKPLVEIIGVLNGALGNLDQAAKDDIFRRIFGQDAIRAAAILTSSGVDGFNQMTQAMGGALSVGEKYKTLMSGLAGAGEKVLSATKRVGVTIGEALAPALVKVGETLANAIEELNQFASKNKTAVVQFAKSAVAAVALGGALMIVGKSVSLASDVFGTLIGISSRVVLGMVSVAASVAGVITSLAGAIISVGAYSVTSIAAAAATGAAWAIANIPLLLLIGAVGGLTLAMVQAYDGVGLVTSAVSSIPGVVGNAITVFKDLGKIGGETFKGISAALENSNFAQAIDILMAGMKAGFLRGKEAVMSVIDGLMNGIESAIGDLMGRWEDFSALFGRVGAFFGNQADQEAIAAIDAGLVEFGSKGRLKGQLEREQQRSQSAAGRAADTKQAVADLQSKVTAAAKPQMRMKRGREAPPAYNEAAFDAKQAEDFIAKVAAASALEELSQLTYDFNKLVEAGNVSTEQQQRFQSASDTAMAKIDPAIATVEAGAKAAGEAGPIAGTFSSVGLGGLGFGSSLAQKQLDTLKAIEQNTREGDEVAA